MISPIPVIVLAGGRSSRFGTDKLDPGTGLLDELIGALLPRFLPILVGPARPLRLADQVVHTRERPPGGGPGAGLIAGLTAARSHAAGAAVGVLPGDGPRGWLALDPLLEALAPGVLAAWCSGSSGSVPVPAAIAPAGLDALLDANITGAGVSLRSLIGRLDPVTVQVREDALFDVDTPDDLVGYRESDQSPHPPGGRCST